MWQFCHNCCTVSCHYDKVIRLAIFCFQWLIWICRDYESWFTYKGIRSIYHQLIPVMFRYNSVSVIQNTHNMHPIIHPWGRIVGRFIEYTLLRYTIPHETRKIIALINNGSRVMIAMYMIASKDGHANNKVWWLCLVPTSTTRFASDVGYRMAKI